MWIIISVALIVLIIILLIYMIKSYIPKNKTQEQQNKELELEASTLKDKIKALNHEREEVNIDLECFKASLNENRKTIEKEEDERVAAIRAESTYEIDEIKCELDKWRSTLAASISAKKRELEKQSDISFYCLDLSEDEKFNLKRLTSLKGEFNPQFARCVLMAVWSAIVRDKVKALVNRVAGTAVTGIYKITSLDTEEVYIGQAVDLAKRAAQHYKCAMGIDTPANNLLYNAMQKYGIDRFSWELLEECKREELNEKEALYIATFDSYNNGFNKTGGNK